MYNTRATADVLLALNAPAPAAGAAAATATPARTTDYRAWLAGRSGGTAAQTAALVKGDDAGQCARCTASCCRSRFAGKGIGWSRRDDRRLFPVRVFVACGRRRPGREQASRGSRNFPIPSPRSRGRRSSSCTRKRRRSSTSSRAITRRFRRRRGRSRRRSISTSAFVPIRWASPPGAVILRMDVMRRAVARTRCRCFRSPRMRGPARSRW